MEEAAMRLLIVGAGPVGLALALALHRQGIRFRQVDKALAPSVHSKALGVQARTLEALAPFGVDASIIDAALRPAGAVLHLGATAVPVPLSHAVHGRYPTMSLLPQAETERLLAGALAAAGAPPPERGVAVVAAEAATGRATLRHADGREESGEYDHLLACDGAHSTLRKAAGIGFAGAAYEEQCVLADGSATGLLPAHLHVYPGHGSALIFFPLPGGSWRAVAMLPADNARPEEGDLSHFQPPGVTFSDPHWWSAFRISHRIADRFRQGRVTLMGDAAHIHSPAGGQGMNLGIQDACSLAIALPRGEAALEVWAAERRRVAAMVVARTDAMTRVILGHGAGIRAARAVALRVMPRIPAIRRRLERGLAGLDYPAIAAPV
jgi:2-polyprenyl-6-methoxyphenol hydroxylase-like FAD-dependent oxidoreductase